MLRVFQPYGEAFRIPGSRAFTGAGLIARFPLALNSLGILLLVSITTGSYAQAGAFSAVFTLTAALAGIFTSRLADSRGQAYVLNVIAPLGAIGLAGLVISVSIGLPIALSVIFTLIGGIGQPAIGSFVRARWVSVSPTPQIRRTGFAWESIADEIIFSVGPLFAAWAAVAIWPGAPLLTSALLLVGGGLWLARQKQTQPKVSRAEERVAHQPAWRSAALWMVVVISVGLGMLFGGFDVATVSFTEARGTPELAGVILGLWAAGSLVGGLFFGSRHWNAPVAHQLRITTTVLVLVFVPVLFVTNTLVLGIAAFIGGLAIAPSLISVFSVAERVVDPPALTEGLTLINAGLALGFATGSAVGGILVDQFASAAAFTLSWGGALLSAGVSLAAYRFVNARTRAEEPDPSPGMIDDPMPGPGAFPA